MKKIPLTQGKFAIVDDEDFERLSQFKWHAKVGYLGQRFIARRRVGSRMATMPEVILGVRTTRKSQIDHINLDTLDNRRENLRLANPHQNTCNRKTLKNNTTGYKGVVVWTSRHGRSYFLARIAVKGRRIHIGTFQTAEEAGRAYDEAAKKYHAEFARTNQEEHATIN